MPNTQPFDMDRAIAIAEDLERRGSRIPLAQVEREYAQLVTDPAEAHELAHRENERRWAAQQTEALGMGTYGEDTEAVQDLLVQVRRNWRLSRETSRTSTYDVFSKYATLSGNAATELEAEYGIEVGWSIDGGWTVELA